MVMLYIINLRSGAPRLSSIKMAQLRNPNQNKTIVCKNGYLHGRTICTLCFCFGHIIAQQPKITKHHADMGSHTQKNLPIGIGMGSPNQTQVDQPQTILQTFDHNHALSMLVEFVALKSGLQ